MLETTKEERNSAMAWVEKRSLTARVIRDVDTLVGALRAEHELKSPHVPSPACHICAVLGE